MSYRSRAYNQRLSEFDRGATIEALKKAGFEVTSDRDIIYCTAQGCAHKGFLKTTVEIVNCYNGGVKINKYSKRPMLKTETIVKNALITWKVDSIKAYQMDKVRERMAYQMDKVRERMTEVFNGHVFKIDTTYYDEIFKVVIPALNQHWQYNQKEDTMELIQHNTPKMQPELAFQFALNLHKLVTG
jgi:hypothetical protein